LPEAQLGDGQVIEA